jgi:DNA-binding transcriptional LysR family regulator
MCWEITRKTMKVLSAATLVLCLCLPTAAFALPQRRPPLSEVRYWIDRLDSDHLVESWQLRGRTLKLTIDEVRWQESFSSNRDFLLRALEQNLGVTVVPQSAHRKRLVEP